MNKKKLEAYFQSEMENIHRVLSDLEKFLDTVPEKAAISHSAVVSVFLHNIYNGFENFLKRLFQFHDTEIQKTEQWHRNLLKVSDEKGWINKILSEQLSNLLSFRHAFVHSYVFSLPWDQIYPLAKSIHDTVKLFETQMSVLFEEKD